MARLDADIEALINRFIPEIRAAFVAVIRDLADAALIAEMVRYIEAGDAVGAFRALGMTETALRPIVTTIEAAFEAGGITTGATFPRVLNTTNGRARFLFDVRNSRAERWLREESSQLVTKITEDTRINVQTLMTTGVADGRNPRNVALDVVGRVDPVTKRRVGGVIGLTTQQQGAVSRARLELHELDDRYFNRVRRDKRFDGLVRNAIRDGKALDAEQISKITARYSDSLLQLRGENVARTEALAALNAAQMEAAEQAIDTGAVKESAAQKEWDSAGADGRTRDTHLAMDGQRVGIREPFVTPGGYRLMQPGDSSMGAPGEEVINCRCRVKLRINFLAGVK